MEPHTVDDTVRPHKFMRWGGAVMLLIICMHLVFGQWFYAVIYLPVALSFFTKSIDRLSNPIRYTVYVGSMVASVVCFIKLIIDASAQY